MYCTRCQKQVVIMGISLGAATADNIEAMHRSLQSEDKLVLFNPPPWGPHHCPVCHQELVESKETEPAFHIRPLADDDREWVEHFMAEQWGDSMVVVHGTIYYPHTLPGLVAVQAQEKVGLITYYIEGNSCEIVSLNSLQPSNGIGTALIQAVKQIVQQANCMRLWLITTNDNLGALRFYQKRGFALVAVHPNALEASRKIKPQIPLVGNDGIPLRDEIELELFLA